MRKALAVLAILLAANMFVSAKMKRFVWEDEICVHEGWYNAALYSEKQLENTYRLWFTQDFELFVRNGERQVDGLMQPVTLAWLDYQYALKYKALRTLEVVDTPYWQKVKRQKLRALEQKYAFERSTLEAVANPLVARRVGNADEVVSIDDEGVLHRNFRKLFKRVREMGCDYA